MLQRGCRWSDDGRHSHHPAGCVLRVRTGRHSPAPIKLVTHSQPWPFGLFYGGIDRGHWLKERHLLEQVCWIH